MKKIPLLLIFFSSLSFSQTITGIVYDEEAPVAGVRVMNITLKSITSSNKDGKFEMNARVNDTLLFSSLFHVTKQVVIKKSHFDDIQVFELGKSLNELEEVKLHNKISALKEEERINKTASKQFKTDVEKNPHLYRRQNRETGPIDFMEIGRRIAKLLKRKNATEKSVPERLIISQELTQLFKNDPFFNDQFLVLNLNITKDNKQLFFAYCETKQLSTALLDESQKFYLTDRLLEISHEFLNILKESQRSFD